jgi:hypothetical protein
MDDDPRDRNLRLARHVPEQACPHLRRKPLAADADAARAVEAMGGGEDPARRDQRARAEIDALAVAAPGKRRDIGIADRVGGRGLRDGGRGQEQRGQRGSPAPGLISCG